MAHDISWNVSWVKLVLQAEKKGSDRGRHELQGAHLPVKATRPFVRTSEVLLTKVLDLAKTGSTITTTAAVVFVLRSLCFSSLYLQDAKPLLEVEGKRERVAEHLEVGLEYRTGVRFLLLLHHFGMCGVGLGKARHERKRHPPSKFTEVQYGPSPTNAHKSWLFGPKSERVRW